jgi:hypothetical protein
MKKPYIVYSLSKDRTTQIFNKSKFPDIIKDLDIFLNSCTTTNIQEPDKFELTAYTGCYESEPSDALPDIIKKTTERFGLSVSEPLSYHYPGGQADSTTKYTWTLSKDKLNEATQYLIENSPMPKSNFGPLELLFTYNFKLTDPIIRTQLQNQEHTSFLLIWFSRNKSCSPTLFFPFENADKDFWKYIDSIVPFLPFKLEEKYLRLAHINKQGEVNSFKKISRSLVT